MKITNKFGLPDTILRANQKRNENYKSNADRSVTQLINPPRIDILRKAHFREMEKDVSEEFFALFGSAVHQILEWGADKYTAEERLYARVAGWDVSGQIDLQYDPDNPDIVDLMDYKVTAVYQILKDQGQPKREWVEQLNCYAHLLTLNKGVSVRSINVVPIIRDWERRKAKTDPLYPAAPIIVIPLPLWSYGKQEEFIKSRVAIHQHAQMMYELGEEMPECSPEERWENGAKYAVMKPGGKRAVRVFESEEFAQGYIEDKGIPGATIVHKPGTSSRCGYCGVNNWCTQYKRMEKENVEPTGSDEDDA